MKVSFEDLYHGVHKKIKLVKECVCERCHGSGSATNSTHACPKCHGRGYIQQTARGPFGYATQIIPCDDCHGTGEVPDEVCPRCGGKGTTPKEVDFEFDIPAGYPDKSYLKFNGEGDAAPRGGIPGNLFIIIEELPSVKAGLTRDPKTNDLLYNLDADYDELVFGCDKNAPTVEGSTKIHIPAGTQPGKKFTVYGKGFPLPGDNRFRSNNADYIITVNCNIPKVSDLTPKQKELLEEYSKSRH